MKRVARFSVVLLLMFSLVPLAGFAACPDQAICFLEIPPSTSTSGSDARYVGTINTPTCWKLGHGCRPWYCDGNSTTPEYWIDQCRQKFNMSGNKTFRQCVTFPLVHKSGDATGASKDYCYPMP